jgi:exodeoxyribonuclease V alpha subunit
MTAPGATAPAFVPVPEALRPWHHAGVLDDGDVALVRTLLCATAQEEAHPDVVLALALAVRAPRLGHVCVELGTVDALLVRDEASAARDALPWPALGGWLRHLAESPLVGTAASAGAHPRPPLVLEGSRLYLARLWHDEVQVAARLLAMTKHPGQLTVVTGGPGSGKTTYIAQQLLARLQALSVEAPFVVALAAPTGKAAARMKEVLALALHRAGATPAVLERVATVRATTLHTLLGARPSGAQERYGHHAGNPLACDLLVVDEMSMVSLPLLARTLEALRPEAQLMLVGDPDQLASVEAGTALADLVRGALDNPVLSRCLVQRTGSHRFGATSGIGALAAAVRDGNAERALAVLEGGHADLTWAPQPAAWRGALPASHFALVVEQARRVTAHAHAGNGAAALRELLALRTLCAHRSGPSGAFTLNARVDEALDRTPRQPWPVGRPVIVTRNDWTLGLANGDLGVVVDAPDGVRVAFAAHDADGGMRLVPPARLEAVDTVHAMTIHKSQGSEFDEVVVVLPPEGSPLLLRELLYTAITRARARVTLVATEGAVRAAVARPVARGSGLAERLGGAPGV